MSERSRREFLKGTLAAGVVASHPRWADAATKRSATDWVTLGNSGVKVTRLAFGTGSWGGKVQRELGQERFTRLVRHAYDRGIRFFETADAYSEMHEMLAIALRGLPRDSYRLMTKMRLRETEDPKATIDRFRRRARVGVLRHPAPPLRPGPRLGRRSTSACATRSPRPRTRR